MLDFPENSYIPKEADYPNPEIRVKYNSLLHEHFRHVYTTMVDDEYYLRRLVFRNVQNKEIHPALVPLFAFSLPPDAPIYMEGYQMLSVIGGCVSDPVQLGRLSDQEHYRICPKNFDGTCGFNCLLTQVDGLWYLLGAVSCFTTYLTFHLKNNRVEVFWQMESCSIAARSEYMGEYVCLISSSSKDEVLLRYAQLIERIHPSLKGTAKSGWCSWYAYYDQVTQDHILQNLQLMEHSWPELEYLQIDDGYQSHMGDWLIPSNYFTGGIEQMCRRIIQAGKKVGIWLAPFIASGDSAVFKEHPDWFVRGNRHRPLCAGDITYGGWRDGLWYMLDFSIPQVREYIQKVFGYFHQQLGIDYFKLDALFWGAIPGLKYAQSNLTATEHYRLGIATIRQAVGSESYLLGCNAPMWPSLGLFEAMRVTDDVDRTDSRIQQQKSQAQARQWMSNHLWLNDVDCLVSTGISGESCQELKNMIISSKGPLILGDALDQLTEDTHKFIRKWEKTVQDR